VIGGELYRRPLAVSGRAHRRWRYARSDS